MRIIPLYRGFCVLMALCLGLCCLGVGKNREELMNVSREPGPDVILDAGHGGIDGGAVGQGGTVEKTVNLAFAFELQRQLEAEGLRVLLTRTEDVSIHDASAKTVRQQKTSDLKNRLALANRYPDALFISLHQNSLPNSSVKGTVLYYGGQNPESEKLAQMLREEILKMQPENHKVIKQAQKNLYILSHAVSPAVLVECGFLSNASEERLLCQPEYRQKLCTHIKDAILRYLSRGFVQ